MHSPAYENLLLMQHVGARRVGGRTFPARSENQLSAASESSCVCAIILLIVSRSAKSHSASDQGFQQLQGAVILEGFTEHLDSYGVYRTVLAGVYQIGVAGRETGACVSIQKWVYFFSESPEYQWL